MLSYSSYFAECNCNGHTTQCHYDEEVAANRQSVDIHGNYDGGAVCENCQHNTMGINCEQCVAGFYRPYGVFPNDTYACQSEYDFKYFRYLGTFQFSVIEIKT